jgi:hypothetical protein
MEQEITRLRDYEITRLRDYEITRLGHLLTFFPVQVGVNEAS